MAFWARFFGSKAGNTTSANTTPTRALEARDDDGFTALHRACLGASHPIEEAEQLIASGADVNARVSDVSVNRHRKQGWTPLHFAARGGFGGEQVDKIRLLISHGAKLEAIGAQAFETPLHLAIANRASASVEALIQSGANVHACLVTGLTAIEMAIKEENAERH
jgi:ankyrin repeat protein